MKPDFNLFDAFRLFDKYNIGHFYASELEDGLNRIGVYAPRSQVTLFFKKYDKNNDGKIRFSEFADALTPLDKIYKDHLERKRPNYDARYPEEALSL